MIHSVFGVQLRMVQWPLCAAFEIERRRRFLCRSRRKRFVWRRSSTHEEYSCVDAFRLTFGLHAVTVLWALECRKWLLSSFPTEQICLPIWARIDSSLARSPPSRMVSTSHHNQLFIIGSFTIQQSCCSTKCSNRRRRVPMIVITNCTVIWRSFNTISQLANKFVVAKYLAKLIRVLSL